MAPIFAEGSVDLHQSIRNWYDSLHAIALVYGDTKTHKANNTSRKIKLALHRAVPVSDLQSPILPFNVTLSVIFYHMLELPICLIQIVAVLSYFLPCFCLITLLSIVLYHLVMCLLLSSQVLLYHF